MDKEKYLEHIAVDRQSFGAHLATLAVAGSMNAFVRYIPVGGENIPEEGPVIMAANHISYADTVTLNSYLYLYQRVPNILVKDGLLKPPVVGAYMRAVHALPVSRGQGAVNQPVLDTALRILDRGDAVMIYPEAHAGRGDDFWPIRGKSGLGYLALKSGAPVSPIAQWGAQDIMWRGDDGKQHVSLLPPRKKIIVSMGEPMTFHEDMIGKLDDPDERRFAEQIVTDAVMRQITEQLGVIRGEEPGGYYRNREVEQV